MTAFADMTAAAKTARALKPLDAGFRRVFLIGDLTRKALLAHDITLEKVPHPAVEGIEIVSGLSWPGWTLCDIGPDGVCHDIET